MAGRAAPILALLALAVPVLWLAPSGPEEVPVAQAPPRLAEARSPYLRQHAGNPVDWYPWGPEAFERARREGRPILLSVGYAACHWCHVMEHESFEDPETARRLNEAFVCVKVDREERPDVDRLYMAAVQVMQRRGGWPMTVLLTPQGKPFWAGTYLPRAELVRLTERVVEMWTAERARVEAGAEQLAQMAAALLDPDRPAATGSDADLFRTLREALARDFDARHGGYGGRPKFPPHTDLLLLLEDDPTGWIADAEREQAHRTLDAMAAGGIHDHVGGGFHRYSTDERWLLPHFEKMLYDNALLAQAYARAHERDPRPGHRRVVERLFDWVERDLRRPGGGYASSLDADTEGEEGLTYTWTRTELGAVLPAADLDLFCELHGVRAEGNFLDEATGRRSGRNVLHRPRPVAEVAAAHGLAPADLEARAARWIAALCEARARRPQPALDEKVIAGWNGLLLSGLAHAGRAFGEPAWIARARALADFLLERCRRPDGTLLRFPRGSGPELVGFCEDHVHVAHGLLDLEEATGEPAYGAAAAALARRLVAGFGDAAAGGFFTADAAAHEALFARTKEAWDSPIPSDNGAAAHLCLRVYARDRDPALKAAADATLDLYRGVMAHPHMVRGVAALLRAVRARAALADQDPSAAGHGDLHRAHEALTVDVFQERAEVRPGEAVALVVRLGIRPGWHLAAPGDPAGGAPVALALAPHSPARIVGAGPAWPAPERRALGAGPAAWVYAGPVDVRLAVAFPADAPHGPRRVPLRLRVAPCTDAGTCLAPIELELDLALRLGPEPGPRRHAALWR